MAAGETARADGATVAEGTVDLIEPVTSWWTDTLAAIGRLYRRASRSVWYDYTLRVPAIAVFYLLAAAQLEELNHHVIAVMPAVERFGVIAEDATNLIALVMFLVLSILRSRPLARAEGLSPRVTALLGTYGLGILLLLAPRPEPSVNWQIISR